MEKLSVLFGALETMMNVENGEKMERVVRERESEREREKVRERHTLSLFLARTTLLTNVTNG